MFKVLDSSILYDHSAQPDIRESLNITHIWGKKVPCPRGEV